MSGVIRWEEPTTNQQTKAERWRPVAEELKCLPGQWAVIDEGHPSSVSSLVTYVKQGNGPFEPTGSFEALSRTLPMEAGKLRHTIVYARYVGTEERG